MFVRKSKYDEVRRKVIDLTWEYDALLSHWNRLVNEINSKGGQKFLEGPNPTSFSIEELKKLRSLVHPDKHNNSAISNELSAKINSML